MPPVSGDGPVIVDPRGRVALSVMAVIAALVFPPMMPAVGISAAEASLAVQGGLVILVGLLAGPVSGGLTGVLTAVVGFSLTGTPADHLVLFVLVELGGSGLIAGLLARRAISPLCGVLLAQAGGRLIHLVAAAVDADGIAALMMSIGEGWASVRGGLVAIMLQWLLIPPIITWVRGRAELRPVSGVQGAGPSAGQGRGGFVAR